MIKLAPVKQWKLYPELLKMFSKSPCDFSNREWTKDEHGSQNPIRWTEIGKENPMVEI